jgi:hypothetical protein
MKRGLIVAAMMCVIGCGPITRDPSQPGPEPVVVKETHWTCIADDIEAGEITDSSKLELIVQRLRNRSRIDDAAVEKFYAAMPGIKDQERTLTKDDAQTLRGL